MNDISITFQLEFEEFSSFNRMLADDIIKKNKKKVTFCGIIEILLACLIFFINISAQMPLYLVLSITLFLVGIFCVSFYPVFFEKQLNKSIAKEFNENPYFQAPTTLTFGEEGVAENNDIGQGFTEYDKISKAFYYEKMLILQLGSSNGYVIPCRCLQDQQKQQLETLLRQKMGDLAKF